MILTLTAILMAVLQQGLRMCAMICQTLRHPPAKFQEGCLLKSLHNLCLPKVSSGVGSDAVAWQGTASCKSTHGIRRSLQ
ncbi:hypothetical protein WJX82_008925 [Trebouxia sp. C0006]